MLRYRITVTPHTSLFIGGYTQSTGGAHGDTARDHDGFLIPATTVKGALREAAVRLVQGAGRGEDLLKKLFGAPDEAGAIRLSPLRPAVSEGEESLALPPTLRHHVTLERATRQAAHQRLFVNRVTPAIEGLRFTGHLECSPEIDEEALGLLHAAVEITDQLGGGRGRGLGLVRVELEAEATPTETNPPEITEPDTSRLILELEARDPLQLGVIKDLTNVLTTKSWMDGSAVRGATAAVLARRDSKPLLEEVFGGIAPAIFGNGYPGDPSAIPAPLTLRESKIGKAPIDEALQLCAEAQDGRKPQELEDTRPAKGTYARVGTNEGKPAWQRISLTRRLVTRSARDHASGRGAHGQLYSREVLEPILTPSSRQDEVQPLRFYVPVSGSPEQLQRIVEAVQEGLLLGAARSRGQGRVRLVRVLEEQPLPSVRERHRRWSEALAAKGISNPERTGALLAVGPLVLNHERLRHALGEAGLELIGGVSRVASHGGWNHRMKIPRNLFTGFVPGSVFLVRSKEPSALPALERLEADGLGPGRPDGWGHLLACHPIHLEPIIKRSSDMSSLDLAQRRAIDRHKEQLVPAAESLLETAGVAQLKPHEFGDSQLRNLLAVASETESPAVVVNFLRYQVGRDAKKKRAQGWASRVGDQGPLLGERFIEQIDGDQGCVEQILAKLFPEPDHDPEERQLAKIELIRHFIGFASRYLTFLGLQRKNGGAA